MKKKLEKIQAEQEHIKSISLSKEYALTTVPEISEIKNSSSTQK